MPLVGCTTTPDEALRTLRKSGQSALIVDVAGNYSLAWASDIGEARRLGLPDVKAILNREMVYLAGPADAGPHNVDLITPRKTWFEYEAMLDLVGAKYAVIAVDHTAFVITRHETLRYLVDSVTLECPAGHLFPLPQKAVGDECPRCPADASGSRPKIRLSQ